MPYRNFKELAERIDIVEVASILRLDLKERPNGELRTACPACKSSDANSLAIMPATRSFRCYSAQKSGDCTSLYAHIKGYEGISRGQFRAADELEELFGDATAPRTAPSTTPQKPERRTAEPSAQPAPASARAWTQEDAQAYAAKLAYTDEIAASGISEEDARAIGIGISNKGMNKGLTLGLRWQSGEFACFVSLDEHGRLKLPKQLIRPSVLTWKRRA